VQWSRREIPRLCGVALVFGGIAAALTLVFLPLGIQQTSSAVGYCGPGFTSDNALQVRIDPGIVNTGGNPGQVVPAAEARQLEQFCTAEADTRLTQAATVGAVALLAGIPLMAVRRRQTSGPSSPGVAGSPPLSSSGAAGPVF
jgi:hypothetical protein